MKHVPARLESSKPGAESGISTRPLPGHSSRRSGLWLAMAAGAGLTACAVGPDFQRPTLDPGASYVAGAVPATAETANAPAGTAQAFIATLDVDGKWWEGFGSPAINALVTEALRANPDLKAAQAALRQAEEAAAAQEGIFYPNVQGNYNGSRQKNPVGTLAPTLNSGVPTFNLHTAQLLVSYVPDVFGGNRRTLESLEAQAEQQSFQVQATYLTLISNVVVGALQEASLRAQIDATQEVISLQRQQLQVLEKQNSIGSIPASDVLAQQAALAQTEATLPPLAKQLEQQRHALIALTGHFPGEAATAAIELKSLTLPAQLPLSLPSKLLEQRPDVRAAEAQLHSASALVGVAMANRLPQFMITGSAGGTSTVFGEMFSAGNTFWNLGLGVTQPIFDGGTLLHRKRGAEAALEQASAQYRSTVITAFQNVADTLTALQRDAEGLEATARADRAARESLEVAKRAVELGSAGYLAVISAEQNYQQVHIGLVQAEANRFADTAALFQALGGGWWNRTGVALSTLP